MSLPHRWCPASPSFAFHFGPLVHWSGCST
jgi:hypothetical protein